MQVLVIEDSRSSAIKMLEQLRAIGQPHCMAADNLDEALRILHASLDRCSGIDMVFIDADIPNGEGIRGCSLIRSHAEFEDLPIVLVANRNDEPTVDDAFNAGATDFLAKPFSNIDLKARLMAGLRLRSEMTNRKIREKELGALARKLERMSNHDGLTGIPNRRFFDDALVKEWVRNGRQDAPLALLMIDIDHFKKYNDALGHVDGDACISTVAQAISNCLRRPGDVVARYGGEEFAVILPDTDRDGAFTVAASIHSAIADIKLHHPASTVACTVTVSIGICSTVPECHTSPELLLHTADQALYHAKKSGRNTSEYFELEAADSQDSSAA